MNEPINVIIGRLRGAIKSEGKARQLELLEEISEWVFKFGLKHYKEVYEPDQDKIDNEQLEEGLHGGAITL